MPTIEGIQPRENRDFLTTLGDWTGDGIWMESAFPEIFNWMRFDTTGSGQQRTAQLEYPHISPGKGCANLLRISLTKQNWEYEGEFYWKLTDGVYEFEETIPLPADPAPVVVETNIDIPSNWTKGNTSLEIMFTSLYDGNAYWRCSRFSLEYSKQKIDYLPIMGIG